MLKVDARSHGEKGRGLERQDVVNRMDTMKVDKTIIFSFTEGYFNNDEIMDYVNENPDRLIPFCAVNRPERAGGAGRSGELLPKRIQRGETASYAVRFSAQQ